jgi:hypothetical protein
MDGGGEVKPDLELPDGEWAAWREQWQQDGEVPAGLRRKVARGTRNLRLMVALEVLVTVCIGGGYTLWAVAEPSAEMRVLAAAAWLFLGVAWAFAAINRRGTWRPAAVSTAEFVDLSIRRCERKLAAARFGVWLYFAEMVFCLVFLYRDPARREPLPAVLFAVATPIFLAGLVRYRRKTRSELEELRRSRRLEME